MSEYTESEMQEILIDLFNYDEETGILTLRKNRRGVMAGTAVGADHGLGYLIAYVRGRKYSVHRLAWLYVYGKWPKLIDHINGNRSDNRLCNLRESDFSKNAMNQRRPQKQNTTGYLGVSRTGNPRTFRAKIFVRGKNIHLGVFDTAEEAHEAYIKAKRAMHETCTL